MAKVKPQLLTYLKKHYLLYLMLVPGFLILFVFTYGPMFGYYLAFVDYKSSLGIFGSEWVGLLWIKSLFDGGFIWEMVGNTLKISLLKLVICFPIPIILAFLINEVNNKVFKSVFQSVSYLPNFISWIIISAIMVILLDTDDGLFNKILSSFGLKEVSWYAEPNKWYGILTFTHMWKSMGWSSIVFLASLTSIDKSLFEAAQIDGAGRFKQIIHISVPCISATINIVLILSIGNIFKDDFEQIYALVGENEILAKTTNVISTWVYKLANSGATSDYALGTAASLMQSIISVLLVLSANIISKKFGQEGIF